MAIIETPDEILWSGWSLNSDGEFNVHKCKDKVHTWDASKYKLIGEEDERK